MGSEEGLAFVTPPSINDDNGEGEAAMNESQELGHLSEDEECDEDLLVALVGDALVEPFWPEGLGIARGFFGVWDACSAISEWAQGESKMHVVKHFQEAYVQLKSVSAATRTRVMKEDGQFSLAPQTRYRNFDPSRRRASYNARAMARRRTTVKHFRCASFLEHAPARTTSRSAPASFQDVR